MPPRGGGRRRRAAAAALAAAALLAGSGCGLVPEEPAYVATDTELQAAMNAGEQDIILTAHVDLTSMPPFNPGSDTLFNTPSRLRTLRVRPVSYTHLTLPTTPYV